MEQNFLPEEANSWWEGGFEKMPKESSEWRLTKLPIHEAWEAYSAGKEPEAFVTQD